MNEKKKKGMWILKLLGILFLLYLSLNIAMSSGYYEAMMAEKTTVTTEAMERFEEDVRNGKEVDINDYITEVHKDYSNGASKAGSAFSQVVEEFMSNGITEMVNVLKKLFT